MDPNKQVPKSKRLVIDSFKTFKSESLKLVLSNNNMLTVFTENFMFKLFHKLKYFLFSVIPDPTKVLNIYSFIFYFYSLYAKYKIWRIQTLKGRNFGGKKIWQIWRIL